jgi:tRNA G18 (ribose-2'-O)-methylase SpoU
MPFAGTRPVDGRGDRTLRRRVRSEAIDGADDPRLADYRRIRDPDACRARGLFVAESRTVVRSLVGGTRFAARSVLCTAPALAALADVLGPADVPVLVATEATIRAVVGFDFHRGCLALGERRAGDDVASVARGAGRVVVGLERVGNPDNVGGVFRNALALGAGGVVLSPGSGDPLYRKAIRVSRGATLAVPFAEAPDWPAALAALHAEGFTLVALVPRGADAVEIAALGRDVPVPPRAALLLGNEGEGLAPVTRALADLRVSIPMAPGADSLNVASAAAIALHRLG